MHVRDSITGTLPNDEIAMNAITTAARTPHKIDVRTNSNRCVPSTMPTKPQMMNPTSIDASRQLFRKRHSIGMSESAVASTVVSSTSRKSP